MNTYTDEQINEALSWSVAQANNPMWRMYHGPLTALLQQRTAKPAPSFPALPPGEAWHNPEGLTPEQVGVDEGWRLQLVSELTNDLNDNTQWWRQNKWSPTDSWMSLPGDNATLRTRAALPEHVLRWQAEQANSPEIEGIKPEQKSDPSASAEPFRITGPGLYRTRDGRKAGPISWDSSGKCWFGCVGNEQRMWEADGKWLEKDKSFDLIAPWTAEPQQPVPEIDWSKVPEGFDWVAMDKSGHWHSYGAKPKSDPWVGIWSDGSNSRYFTLKILAHSSPDWTQSLVQRPAPKPAPDERSSTERLFEELQQDCPYLFEIPDPKFHNHFQRKQANRDAIREALEYGYQRAKEELNETTSRVSE